MRPTSNPRQVTLRLPESLVFTLRVALVVAIVGALYYGKEILMPLALAALLAFLLDPLVTRLRRWRLPRAWAVGVVTVLTLGAVAGGSFVVGQQLMQLARDLPRYQSTIETKLRQLRTSVTGDPSVSSASRLIGAVEKEVERARGSLHPGPNGSARAEPPEPLRVKVAAAETSPTQAVQALVAPVLDPLLTAGIVAVLLVFILLERNDIRDRVLRLAGGDLHPMTDALGEAALRVARYLRMQLFVNVIYGLPLALGLWLIGIPGAWLWGVMAAALRFVPYVGPVVAAVFPLTMAFAIDPGWSLFLWTLALVVTIELISNNIVEPWLYGASTGLAPVAVLLSAAFWTLLWGPIGLVLATPLTVCLVVMGRHLPALRFLDLMLGSDPAFDTPTRLYQRLLGGDVESAIEIAETEIDEQGLTGFYSQAALPALAQAAADHSRVSSAEHRNRVREGMASLLRELRSERPAEPDLPVRVRCLALRWEADTLAAEMVAHALALDGVGSGVVPALQASAERIGELDLRGVEVVCLSTFHTEPEALLRYTCRRLLRLRPDLKIVLGLWNAPSVLREPGAAVAFGAAAAATSLQEAVDRVHALLQAQAQGPEPGPDGTGPADGHEASAEQLALCRRMDPARASASLRLAQRAAEVFDAEHALVRWVDDRVHSWQANPAREAPDHALIEETVLRPVLAERQMLVVPDAARDPRFTVEQSQALAHRFVAAVPVVWRGTAPLAVLCVVGLEPRRFDEREARLFEALAQDLTRLVDTVDVGDPPSTSRAAAPGLPVATLPGAA